MRILLPTMRDPGQIGGTTTHISMLARGLVTAERLRDRGVR